MIKHLAEKCVFPVFRVVAFGFCLFKHGKQFFSAIHKISVFFVVERKENGAKNHFFGFPSQFFPLLIGATEKHGNMIPAQSVVIANVVFFRLLVLVVAYCFHLVGGKQLFI